MFVCNKCCKQPADGEKLRYCKGCKAAYCGIGCQHADWDAHKLICRESRAIKRQSVESYGKANGFGANEKENRLALLEWYSTKRVLSMEVVCLAWRHRASSPVIAVTTSSDGSDAHAPLVTAVPRSEWPPSYASVATFFDRVGFQVDNEYFLSFELLHPGGEGQANIARHVVKRMHAQCIE